MSTFLIFKLSILFTIFAFLWRIVTDVFVKVAVNLITPYIDTNIKRLFKPKPPKKDTT